MLTALFRGRLLGFAAAAALLAAWGCGGKQPETEPVGPASLPAPTTQRSDDFGKMIRATGMSGAELAAFEAKLAQRDAELAAWENGPQGQKRRALQAEFDAAKKAKDEAKADELRPKLQALADEHAELRRKGRSMVVATMSFESQKKWSGFSLNDRVLRRLRSLGIRTTAEEQARIRAICDEEGARWIKPGVLEKDPYLAAQDAELVPATLRKIGQKVLTADQREKLEAALAAQPTK